MKCSFAMLDKRNFIEMSELNRFSTIEAQKECIHSWC